MQHHRELHLTRSSKIEWPNEDAYIATGNAPDIVWPKVMPVISLGIRSPKGGCVDFVFATRLRLLEQYFLVVLSAVY